MQEFLLNIDNKEILNEVIHHSIDFLIGSCNSDDNSSTLSKSSHKYGFANPEEFESAIEIISTLIKLYTLTAINEKDFLSQFTHMNSDLQQVILEAIEDRRTEITQFLLRELNSNKHKLMLSFDWDIRLIFGDNYNPTLRTQIATVSLNLLDSSNIEKPKTNTLTFEMDKEKLNELIQVLEDIEDKILTVENTQTSTTTATASGSSESAAIELPEVKAN